MNLIRTTNVELTTEPHITYTPCPKKCHNYQLPPNGWDVDIYKKMRNKSYKERLIIAGALIAAELDRLSISDK